MWMVDGRMNEILNGKLFEDRLSVLNIERCMLLWNEKNKRRGEVWNKFNPYTYARMNERCSVDRLR